MKIGLVGGSFNPPHKGHLHISEIALKSLNLNQIWWLPTLQNPLKDIAYKSYQSRLDQCHKITKHNHKIRIKELSQIYTIDLIKLLQRRYPTYQFYWIAGADNITNFHRWKKFKELIKLIPFVIVSRETFLTKHYNTKAYKIYMQIKRTTGLTNRNLPHFTIIHSKNINISSTQLRSESS